jgi:hypothetical protein
MQLLRCIILIVLVSNFTLPSFAQRADSAHKTGVKNLKGRFQALTKTPRKLFKPADDTVAVSIDNPFRNLFSFKPLARFSGGYVSYNFNYRSSIDTPYVESNIAQHNVMAMLNFRVAGIIPMSLNFRTRQSNSQIFRDITDVQLSFNAAEFRNNLQEAVKKRMLALAPQLNDTITQRLYELKNLRVGELGGWLRNPFHLQKLIECNEILKVPRVTYDPMLPDSINAGRADSLKKVAAFFLELYEKTSNEYKKVVGEADSLRKKYDESLLRIKQYREMLQGKWQELSSPAKWKNELKKYGLDSVEIPAKYRWLAGLRQLSLGRAPVNYTDLTARNISVNGINFEYNSWYYLAVAAGLVDYRFRDFAVNRFSKTPQHLIMVRAGIGRLEHNYFIVSAYNGRKQLFRGNNGNGLASMNVSGLSIESKYHITPNVYLNGEIGTSFAPDLRNNPPGENTKLDFSDKTNKAYSIRAHGWWPSLNTRVEGYYRYSGANFQSFSSFQSNATRESWYIKAEQGFFGRKLRINASLRSNEFTNPFIVQRYNSNTIFKSISASLRLKKWPSITVGYLPMSQYTRLDSQLVESRFQSLNTSLFHQYKVWDIRSATTMIYNRFYNTSSDTGFIYYNAVNFYLSQSFFFRHFTVSASASHTSNSDFELNVLDGSIQLNLNNPGSVGLGVKINNMNNTINKVGGYVNAALRVFKNDMLYLTYEHGYIPGFTKGLTRNEMATVQFTKYFNYR